MLKYTENLKSHALRYLEFEAFDEKNFLDNLVQYMKSIHYTDNVMVRDVGRRRDPKGKLRPKFEVCLCGEPVFELVSNNASSCFIGAAKRASRAGVKNAESILDAFLHHFRQPREFLEVSF
ncbi:MAG: hypothetical protein ACE5FT_04125 [Candidatus Nanoarchaeia archaeon]